MVLVIVVVVVVVVVALLVVARITIIKKMHAHATLDHRFRHVSLKLPPHTSGHACRRAPASSPQLHMVDSESYRPC